MKLLDLTLWVLVILLIPWSFAELIQTTETPSQSAYELGIGQGPQETETPSQQIFLLGPNRTSQGSQPPIQSAYVPVPNQPQSEVQERISPGIAIISPKDGTTIPAGNVTVTATVTNFKLVNMLGGASAAGEGHIHFYMDVPVPSIPGKPALTAVGTFAPTYNTSWTWPNVAPGKHNLSVQLVNNDHTPLVPLVYETVNITAT